MYWDMRSSRVVEITDKFRGDLMATWLHELKGRINVQMILLLIKS
jgi:hypothetical protein